MPTTPNNIDHLDCEFAPICHHQYTLDIAKLKDILILVDSLDYKSARESILLMIKSKEAGNLAVTGRG